MLFSSPDTGEQSFFYQCDDLLCILRGLGTTPDHSIPFHPQFLAHPEQIHPVRVWSEEKILAALEQEHTVCFLKAKHPRSLAAFRICGCMELTECEGALLDLGWCICR